MMPKTIEENYLNKDIMNFYQSARKTRDIAQKVVSNRENKIEDLRESVKGKYSW